MIDQTYLDALFALGAGDIPHSNRKLLDHLLGTHNLLMSWKSPRETCLAGLFHSIYGTVRFRKQSVPIASRKTIQELIGPEAEQLVYLFGVTDRREFYANIGCSTCRLHDLREQTQWSGSPTILNQLLTMDLANWLEMFPYIGQELSVTEISRTIEMFETAKASYPVMAVDSLMRVKKSRMAKSTAVPNQNLLS